MGNGATFCLETLIFAAACYAVGESRPTVYGDDIIIDVGRYPQLLRFMRFLGFRINEDKTHTSGPFRESCGGNYYHGTDITPFYVRDTDMRKANLCHILNGLMSLSWPGSNLGRLVLSLQHEWCLPLVPYTENSTHGLWITTHDAYRLRKIKVKYGVAYFRGYLPRVKHRRIDDSRALFLWYLDTRRRKHEHMSHCLLGTVRGLMPLHRDKETVFIRSRVPSGRVKYTLRWCHWEIPVTVAPDHVYTWSEELVRPKG
jgi:hypothetical protein